MEEIQTQIYPEFNKYQTALSDKLKKELPKEVWNDLFEFITTVKFISWITSKEEVRGYAKDKIKYSQLPETDFRRTHYSDDRIVVDISKPHILENMDFFRERAIYYRKHGRYTHIRPNSNPKSTYAAFWKEELRRWKEGLVRESDGEWISGYYYFYLNYVQIFVNKRDTKDKSKKSGGERVRDFPDVFLGDYLFYHYVDQAIKAGSHVKMLKARGIGASYKFSAMSPCNMYTKSGLPNFHLASDKTFLDGEKGVFGKVADVLDFIADNTPMPRMRLINSLRSREIQLGYQDEYGSKQGLKSSVFGISLKDNPDKARGVRGPLIHYEEDGLFKDLEKAWNVNRKAVEDGNITFGLMAAAGTGGTEGADFEGSEKMFRGPLAYNIYGIPNVFDKNSNEDQKCGFFWGAYLNRAECYDKDTGEPDVIGALIEILKDRYFVKYNSTDPATITQKMAEEPIVPSEAVMRTSGTIFPVADLKEYKESVVLQGNRFFDPHYVGDLIMTNGGIEWRLNSDAYPIRTFPTGNNKPEGAIEIFEMPKFDASGKVDPDRYIAGIDPVDDDESATNSLTSIFILDLYTDRIVAEYTGRPKFANDFYEICRRLLLFYNAKANYENNKKGLFSYFDQKKCLHLLCDTPQILRDMDYIKGVGYGNKSKGTNASLPINIWGRRLQRDWMLSPAYQQDFDAEGNQLGERLNIHTIRSVAYLEELIQWNQNGNFDRISAMGMLMIYRQDRIRYSVKDGSNKQEEEYDKYIEENFKNAYI